MVLRRYLRLIEALLQFRRSIGKQPCGWIPISRSHSSLQGFNGPFATMPCRVRLITQEENQGNAVPTTDTVLMSRRRQQACERLLISLNVFEKPVLSPTTSNRTSNRLEHLLAFKRFGQVLVSALRDQNVILDANTANGHISLQHLSIDVLSSLWIRQNGP